MAPIGYWLCAASVLLSAVSLVGWAALLYEEGPDVGTGVMALLSLVVLILGLAILAIPYGL